MLDYASDPMIDQSWIPSSAWVRPDYGRSAGFEGQEANFAEEVPVMLATVLGLELLLREPCLDLRMASEIVLSDVGATIQILRLVGKQDDCGGGKPERMGECLASLEANVWFNAISARTFACDREHSATTAVWSRCRLVAQYSQLVAESLEGVPADSAYLVGLLHEVGAIETVLGWPNDDPCRRDQAALLVMERALPPFVLAAMGSVNDPLAPSTWKFILTAAHELAGGSAEFDASALTEIDSMGICSRWEGLLSRSDRGLSDGMAQRWLGVCGLDEALCFAEV